MTWSITPNLSIYDISLALSREDRSISPAAVAEILRAEGFGRLPRWLDDERPEKPRPTIAEVVMVPHEHKPVEPPSVNLNRPAEPAKPLLAVRVIAEDVLPRVPP